MLLQSQPQRCSMDTLKPKVWERNPSCPSLRARCLSDGLGDKRDNHTLNAGAAEVGYKSAWVRPKDLSLTISCRYSVTAAQGNLAIGNSFNLFFSFSFSPFSSLSHPHLQLLSMCTVMKLVVFLSAGQVCHPWVFFNRKIYIQLLFG